MLELRPDKNFSSSSTSSLFRAREEKGKGKKAHQFAVHSLETHNFWLNRELGLKRAFILIFTGDKSFL